MCHAEEGAAGGFVDSARFDADESIFDNVYAAYGVGSGNFVGVHEEF